jgi:hypothetical protein
MRGTRRSKKCRETDDGGRDLGLERIPGACGPRRRPDRQRSVCGEAAPQHFLNFLPEPQGAGFAAANFAGSGQLSARKAQIRLTPERGDHLQGRGQLVEDALPLLRRELGADFVRKITAERQDRHKLTEA